MLKFEAFSLVTLECALRKILLQHGFDGVTQACEMFSPEEFIVNP
jgi:hypothetical protein